jgi:hypothetical protein
MLAQLGLKDIGTLISIVGAALSIVFFLLSFRLSVRMASRSLNLEAQKMLLELNRQLISDPWLWSIYDEHPVRTEVDFGSKCTGSGLFDAKLQAFAYLCLITFEVILAEAPKPARRRRNESNIWVDFFHDSIARSSAIRRILESPDAARMWSPTLIACYREKYPATPAGADASTSGS